MPSPAGGIFSATYRSRGQSPTSSAKPVAASDTKPKIKSEGKIMTAKPFYCLELQIDADFEDTAEDQEAITLTDLLMGELLELIKKYEGSDIHISYKLVRELIEYEWNSKHPDGEPADPSPRDDQDHVWATR